MLDLRVSRAAALATFFMLSLVSIGPMQSVALGISEYASWNRGSFPDTMPGFTEIPTGNSSGQYTTVAMGDVNNDGIAELLSGGHEYGGGTPSGLYLWQYSGSGWTRQTLNNTGSYGQVALADVTNNGILDAIGTLTLTDIGMRLFKGSYSGSSISFTELPMPFNYSSMDGIAIGDINGDGHNDMVVGTWWAGIQVLVNDGNNPPSWTNISIPHLMETTGVALADMNGDGKKDIIAACWTSMNATVYLCTGTKPITYDSGHDTGLGVGVWGFGVAAADFNGDGHMDIAVAANPALHVFLGNGCNDPETGWWHESGVTDSGTPERMQVAVGDINGDGYKDIAYGSASGIDMLENDGFGNFTRVTPSGLPASGKFYGCCLYDFDKDGDLDLAASGWGAGVHFYRNDMYAAPEFPSTAVSIFLIACTAITLFIFHPRRGKIERA